METNYTTDNRWSPGSSGAEVPANAPAAYSARWIDQGDMIPADVVPDRQGFAYSDTGYRDDLIDALKDKDHIIRIPGQRDAVEVTNFGTLWSFASRRAGGYIYVDAWLTPATTTVSVPETTDVDHACVVCGAPGARSYCPDCGSEQDDDADMSRAEAAQARGWES